ncbi:MAG: CatA-like O-acetyltransferase [Haliscomenobacter sp.]|uniref:CatA-like O-acetyltransferase n=1 Tax=Haliscomenobacter sp. TaxID=2717303 RepID=UPI0029B513F3|nr:CatA-like O-acetyltransferase [Haliscomenobacter sp.]MDX2068699.1 CatA-like O-acetyltransferase [Haliscomenobacter sp.]
MYKEFDIDNWNRKNVFDFFRTYDDPFFGISSSIDITNLYKFCKTNGHSLNLAILYFSTHTANTMLNFRLRLLNGKVVLFDHIHCGTTVLHADETFSFCFIDFKPSFSEFELLGKELIKKQLKEKKLEPKSELLNVIHYSTIPWTSFSSIKHAKKMGTADSIPKITFGKYFSDGEKINLPISIEVNHALMDGFHVGAFLKNFQETIDKL